MTAGQDRMDEQFPKPEHEGCCRDIRTGLTRGSDHRGLDKAMQVPQARMAARPAPGKLRPLNSALAVETGVAGRLAYRGDELIPGLFEGDRIPARSDASYSDDPSPFRGLQPGHILKWAPHSAVQAE